MIAYLKGTISYIFEHYIILMCGGVGYRIEGVSMKPYVQEGQTVGFFIYTHVRENELRLFGFENEKDLELFELLIDVNGIGPKLALSLISKLGGRTVAESILEKDADSLRVSGVGKKSANKIILELFDKLEAMGYKRQDKFSDASDRKRMRSKLDEAKEALKSLGYQMKDIQPSIEQIAKNDAVMSSSVASIVKHILQHM
jgi:Holliday junction DNA helicase RuvA